MLCDSHCHLYFKDLQNNLATVLKNAYLTGVNHFIVPGVDLKTNQQALILSKKYKSISSSLGIHPFEAGISNLPLTGQLGQLEGLIKKEIKHITAIGECGLDFTKKGQTLSKNDQNKLFIGQIRLALKYNLPLIIHKRKADKEIFTALKPFKGRVKGVFHSFAEDSLFVNKALEFGFLLGINGLLTYNPDLEKTVTKIPLNHLLLETDAPFLTPQPLKEKRKWPNEPKNVKIVALKLARVKKISFKKISQITVKNTASLFNIKI